MQEFHICYSVSVWYRSVASVSEPPIIPTNDGHRQSQPTPEPEDTSSRFLLDIKVETALSDDGHSYFTMKQPCFCRRPEKAQVDERTLFGHIRSNIVLTELLPPTDTAQDTDSPVTTEHTGSRRPITLVKDLDHVHFEADYGLFMDRQNTDFANDARDFLHDMAQELKIAGGERFSALVWSALVELVARGTAGSRPEYEAGGWYDELAACIDPPTEDRYVEAFGGALEELHGRCAGYEKTREIH
ncbi:hypothetical protein PG994_003046 [Apiospora phragmitis]|uniref:Uncharacterized protein n=1 Tax=Apiospora phragmitis TaxID=2905665 RepID=A0ABR1W6Y4_9PEZI